MSRTVSQIRAEWADREAIREVIHRYVRGVDRCDEELVRSCYWEDAIDTHMVFSGKREAFLQWLLPNLRAFDATMHLLGQSLIDIQGGSAQAETYFYGYHRLKAEPENNLKMRDLLGSGRYLDKLERRGDEWRILSRYVQVDWYREYPDAGDWEAGVMGMKLEPGKRLPEDISYRELPGFYQPR